MGSATLSESRFSRGDEAVEKIFPNGRSWHEAEVSKSRTDFRW
jgi:hypothetical protein